MRQMTRWAPVAFLAAVAVAVAAAVGSASAGGRVLHFHVQGYRRSSGAGVRRRGGVCAEDI